MKQENVYGFIGTVLFLGVGALLGAAAAGWHTANGYKSKFVALQASVQEEYVKVSPPSDANPVTISGLFFMSSQIGHEYTLAIKGIQDVELFHSPSCSAEPCASYRAKTGGTDPHAPDRKDEAKAE